MPRLTWILAVIAATAGCRQILGLDDLAVARDADVARDTPDGSDADPITCESWVPKSGHFVPCDVPPGDTLVLAAPGTWTLDTETGVLRDPMGDPIMTTSYLNAQPDGGPDVRIVSAASFTLDATVVLRVTGARPLVIASWGPTQISGTLNIASERTGAAVVVGAGANGMSCPVAGVGQGPNETGGGGGGGFGGNGGTGGGGKNGQNAGGTGGLAIQPPRFIEGGCRGGNGGVQADSGRGGAGGGAIEIASPLSIVIDGAIHAGGAGGGGGNDFGGGGGGSGGYIGLDAPAVMIPAAGVVAANGGGGGAGCDNGNAAHGENGKVSAQPALGGISGCAGGTKGGDGAAGADNNGDIGATGHNGAGGGAGAGFVLVWGTWSGQGIVSPQITQR